MDEFGSVEDVTMFAVSVGLDALCRLRVRRGEWMWMWVERLDRLLNKR
jgi:hypothetical protein